MKVARFGALILIGGLLLAGCQGEDLQLTAQPKLTTSNSTVKLGIQAMGGLETWKNIDKASADALVTFYNEQGQPYVNRQAHVINVHGRVIRAIGETSKGEWQARYSPETGWLWNRNTFAIKGGAKLDEITPGRLEGALTTLLHRVRGPLNLVGGDEMPGNSEKVWLNSQDLVRVPVENGSVKAYYFGLISGLLQMVTEGGDEPGQPGTVTLYTYQILPNGVVFPKTIRVVEIGRHVLVSQAPILEVEYSNVTATVR